MLSAELSVNIYRDADDLPSPASQYKTPTEEFANASIRTRDSSIVSELDGPARQNQLTFKAKHLEMGMVQRTYDMKVSLRWNLAIVRVECGIYVLITISLTGLAPLQWTNTTDHPPMAVSRKS